MKSVEPLVSVIIPVYNVYPYLREALDSVINQTYRNLEIIIVDDGSMDRSGEICDEYLKDPRVQVIHQENRGLGGARNTGLDRMSGACVAFLDSDDAFEPDMIRQMMDTMERHQADMVICDFDSFKMEGRMTEIKRRKSRTPVGKELVFTGREAFEAHLDRVFTIAVWNKFYRKQLWETVRFPEKFAFEDLCAIPPVLEQCGRVVKISQALVKYRIRKGSITNTRSVQNMRDFMTANRCFIGYLEKLRPEVQKKRIQDFWEETITSLILDWTALRKQDVSPEELSALKKEIQAYGEESKTELTVRGRVKRELFQVCPQGFRVVHQCWRFLKHFVGKAKRVLFSGN